MAKARMLSQDVSSDMRLKRCSLEAAFTYVCTIPFLDRDGLVSGSPAWIAGHALTERTEMHTRVGSYVEEWVTQGLVTRYEGNNGPVLFFHGFRKHNSHMDYRREPESKFPPPPNYIHGEDGLLPLNPRLARTVANAFDKRNSYRIALLIHADRLLGKEAMGLDAADEIIEQALSRSKAQEILDIHKDSGDIPVKVSGVSGESLRVNTIQDQKQEKLKTREENNNNNMRGAEAETETDVVVVLKAFGVTENVATRFGREHSPEYIDEKIAYLKYEQEHHPKKVDSPAGWLRRAIEEDYGPPNGYTPGDLAQREAARRGRYTVFNHLLPEISEQEPAP